MKNCPYIYVLFLTAKCTPQPTPEPPRLPGPDPETRDSAQRLRLDR